MKLIVGLGNPGEKYEATRHNLGFMTLDYFLKDYPTTAVAWSSNTKLKSDIALLDTPKGERVILAKPQTYMNDSGFGVKLIADFYKVAAENVWVVHDELDLPVSTLRIRLGGAAAGHHGVESVIEQLGTDKFWRFRMGVGVLHTGKGDDGKVHTLSKTPLHNVNDFVLGNFDPAESRKIHDAIKLAAQALGHALEHDLTTAMNKYNTR